MLNHLGKCTFNISSFGGAKRPGEKIRITHVNVSGEKQLAHGAANTTALNNLGKVRIDALSVVRAKINTIKICFSLCAWHSRKSTKKIKKKMYLFSDVLILRLVLRLAVAQARHAALNELQNEENLNITHTHTHTHIHTRHR